MEKENKMLMKPHHHTWEFSHVEYYARDKTKCQVVYRCLQCLGHKTERGSVNQWP